MKPDSPPEGVGDGLRLIEKIASLKIEMSTKEREKESCEKVKEEMRLYDIFLQAVSKKGIPLQIMSSQLPVINSEISRILLAPRKAF